MSQGNHWECLGGTAEEQIKRFIPLICAMGEIGTPLRRVAPWFDSVDPIEEIITPLTYPATPLRCLAILVTETSRKTNNFYTAFPYAGAGGKRRLRLLEIRDWGNHVEGQLLCETPNDNILVGFFDTHYFANLEKYRTGEEYDFRLAGLVYEARCTNGETIQVTDQSVLEERYAAWGKRPQRLPDGTLPSDVIHMEGLTGLGPSDKYPDDAEFYCVVEAVSAFELEDIRIYQITPRFEDDDCRKVPLPNIIFGAATTFRNGYIPSPGDSIDGTLWVQGHLVEVVTNHGA